jgi:hypothetical protein
MSGSLVATFRPDGTDACWLGQIGNVNGVTYTNTLPGGNDTFGCTLETSLRSRNAGINVGRLLRVYRGGSVVWSGVLAEPAPSDTGWALSAVGEGSLGGNFVNTYSVGAGWTAEGPITGAIGRGLPWRFTAGSISGTAGLYTAEPQDSGSQTITDHLNLLTQAGSLTWRVRRGVLSLLKLPAYYTPAQATRLLVTPLPVARTVAAYTNALAVRYQSTKETATKQARVATAYGTLAPSIALHGRIEAGWDITAAGYKTSTQAGNQAVAALDQFRAVSYAGSFTVTPGDLLTAGGVPVDLGCEHAGEIVQLISADGGYGGEVTPVPVVFIAGSASYNDDARSLEITPFQSVATNLSSLLTAIAGKWNKSPVKR